jgi:Ca-activated chloride channel family protein
MTPARDQERLHAAVDRLAPGGSTNLEAGLVTGYEVAREGFVPGATNRVILLSDGLANRGPSSTRELVALGRELREGGMSVTTIGLGDHFNEDLMTGLAEASRANYYYVRDAEKLPGIFTEELGTAGAKIAAEVTIRIEVAEGVRLKGILGHPEIPCQGRSAQIAVNELFGAERRVFHVSCAVEEGVREDALAVANVALAYEDAASKKRMLGAAQAMVRLTDDTASSEKSVHADVAKEVAVVQNRLDREAAVKLADEGRAAEASKLLQMRAVANASAPVAQQVPKMAEENRKLESWAEELKNSGNFGLRSRKEAQYDNYRDKFQKQR